MPHASSLPADEPRGLVNTGLAVALAVTAVIAYTSLGSSSSSAASSRRTTTVKRGTVLSTVSARHRDA